MKILLGISGGIAAYKCPELVRELQKSGHEVRCVLTESAARFVSPLVLESLTGHKAPHDLFASGMEHIELARWPDVLLIAPATAQTVARLAHGMADDLLSATALATRARVLIAPAMNTAMWQNPATQANLATLSGRGIELIEPDTGRLACGEEGMGKLPELSRLVASVLGRRQDLAGTHWLITAGPTKTHIDPVRYITNPSTGLMGRALACEALARGATVHYVLGIDKGVVRPEPRTPDEASRLHLVTVHTATEMLQASLEILERARKGTGFAGVIATAAVMDYEVTSPSASKLKRSTSSTILELAPAVDVLGTLREKCNELFKDRTPRFVGFAAETDDVLANGLKKLASKKLDHLFANPIARIGEDSATGFGSPTNSGYWISGDSTYVAWELGPKQEIASRIWDALSSEVSSPMS